MVKGVLKGIKLIYYTIIILFILAFIFSLAFPFLSISRLIYKIFGFLCHQGDGITIGKNYIVLPLCYRCTGMYLFILIGSLFGDIYREQVMKKFHIGFLIIGTAPLVVDGFFKYTAHIGVPVLTFTTGVLFGFTCGLSIIYGVNILSSIQR